LSSKIFGKIKSSGLAMTSREAPSRLKQPLTSVAYRFDYAALEPETRTIVQQHTSEIKERLWNAVQVIWEIGQKLFDVRNRLDYGQFTSWLKVEFDWSRSTAYNYINVFESFGSCSNFGQLAIATSALYLLATPSTPKEARQEALEQAYQGETITYTKAKVIVARYKKLARSKPSQAVTFDVPSATLERKLSASAEPPPVTLSSYQLEPLDEPAFVVEVEKSAEPIGEELDADQSESRLLGEEQTQLETQNYTNHADVYDRPLATLPPSIPIDLNEICKTLINNLQYLTDAQIDAVWQAIAHRIHLERLALPNWPDSKLKQLLKDAERELNSRHTMARL